eukprot:CAMPEP_0170556234 /NCGR_PEP_ID=MMETSP0211-20121228/15798_1 /TAXON_ID=311385 /ORGANISM="Pseudokeronopsis sp., Strain OXSARD2" /LENGTH=76 /DNA_ID=CAMNT_0010866435 /DNA_START=16 /DNA_END=246 /DNA_ORIENTATION=+
MSGENLCKRDWTLTDSPFRERNRPLKEEREAAAKMTELFENYINEEKENIDPLENNNSHQAQASKHSNQLKVALKS